MYFISFNCEMEKIETYTLTNHLWIQKVIIKKEGEIVIIE